MCTVSFVPLDNDSFVLTSNRDEAPSRNSGKIIRRKAERTNLLFPQDAGQGGTWICTSSDDRLVCLLNGAFERHVRKLPYRRSRGLMVLDFFEFETAESFFETYDFNNIEPFTMVVWDKGRLFELRRDETTTHTRQLDTAQKHIWSSSTLYDRQMTDERLAWFKDWQKQNPTPLPEDVLQLHLNGGKGNEHYDYVMNRANIVCTVSVTQIIRDSKGMSLTFRQREDWSAFQKETISKHNYVG